LDGAGNSAASRLYYAVFQAIRGRLEAQATDRANRIGQERRVTVYRLVTKNTIEQQIVELHKKKQRLARSLLDETEGSGNVTADELLRWLAARDHA
jgi:hypothetical protein